MPCIIASLQPRTVVTGPQGAKHPEWKLMALFDK